MHLALLEDEPMIIRSLRTYLLHLGYTVDIYTDGDDFLKHISKRYDLYLIDINIPGANGIECLKKIRFFYPANPVIIMSGLHDMQTIERSFELGSSDYLKKPFNLRELQARIKRFFPESFSHASTLLSLNCHYTFDPKSQKLFYKGELQSFTKKEYALIRLLILKRNSIVTEEDIYHYVYQGSFPESVAIRSLITRVRNKLKENMIENVRGIGYRLTTEA